MKRLPHTPESLRETQTRREMRQLMKYNNYEYDRRHEKIVNIFTLNIQCHYLINK